jgi:hypothetical protein
VVAAEAAGLVAQQEVVAAEAAGLVAQQEVAAAEAAVPVAQQEVAAAEAAGPVAQQEVVAAEAAVPVAQQEVAPPVASREAEVLMGSAKCRAMAAVPASAPPATAAVAAHCRSGFAMDLGRPSLRPASGKLSASSAAAVDLRSHRAAAVRGIWASPRQPARPASAIQASAIQVSVIQVSVISVIQVSAVMPSHRASETESEMGSEKAGLLWRPRVPELRLQASVIQVSVIQVSAVMPSHRVSETELEMGSEKASLLWRLRVQELRLPALQVPDLQLEEPQAKDLQVLASACRWPSAELPVALLVACGSPRPERAVWPVERVEGWE